MTGDQADAPRLGVRKLPRRAIMAPCRTSPALTRAGEKTDKTGGAPRRPCQNTPAAPIEVHPLRPATRLTPAGEPARFPLVPRAKRKASMSSFTSSIKGVHNTPWRGGETRHSRKEENRV